MLTLVPNSYLKDKKYLDILFNFYREFNSDKCLEIARLLTIPLFAKDLPINGEDFIVMGITGALIGKIQKDILKKIYEGKMINSVYHVTEYAKTFI